MKKSAAVRTLGFIDNGCYFGNVLVNVGYTKQEVIDWLISRQNNPKGINEWVEVLKQTEIIEKSLAQCSVQEWHNGPHMKIMPIIWFKNPFSFTDKEMVILAHEIVHLCQMYLADYLRRDREFEAEAYYHSHIMQQCLNLIRDGHKVVSITKKKTGKGTVLDEFTINPPKNA